MHLITHLENLGCTDERGQGWWKSGWEGSSNNEGPKPRHRGHHLIMGVRGAFRDERQVVFFSAYYILKSCVPDCCYSSQRDISPRHRRRNCSRAHKQQLLDQHMSLREQWCRWCYRWHRGQPSWLIKSKTKEKYDAWDFYILAERPIRDLWSTNGWLNQVGNRF